MITRLITVSCSVVKESGDHQVDNRLSLQVVKEWDDGLADNQLLLRVVKDH